jgi:hypothetical protein
MDRGKNGQNNFTNEIIMQTSDINNHEFSDRIRSEQREMNKRRNLMKFNAPKIFLRQLKKSKE